MTKPRWILAILAVLALMGAALGLRDAVTPPGAVAQGPAGQQRAVPVDTAVAVRKPVPVRIDSIGTVMPIASVALKSRLETQVMEVHFSDGSRVKEGDLLFTLDARALQAQIKQAEGILARDRAQFEGAERDLRRFSELVGRGAATQVNLDNARTQVEMLRASVKAGESALENLRVQLSYTEIRAPIPGRISAASAKAGNFVRPADTTALATINQIAPIYVAFSVPQRLLPDVRKAIQNESAKLEAVMPGDPQLSQGTPTMIDNAVDAATGMVSIRATMENKDERLWPGALVNTQLILRVEDAVTVPSVAVQTGQSGTFVFVVREGVARVQPVTVTRSVENTAVIGKGLEDGDTVVTDGQLLLGDGVRVAPRRKAGA